MAETHRLLGQLVLEGDRQGRVPGACVDVEDLAPGCGVGQGEAQLTVEAAGATESRVHGIRPVGGTCGERSR